MKIQGLTKRERHAAKLKIGWAIAERGGCMSDFADALGVSRPSVTAFLKMYPELHRALVDGRCRPNLPAHERAERILMLAQVRLGRMRWVDVARAFGVTSSGIRYWADRNADEVYECVAEIDLPLRRAA